MGRAERFDGSGGTGPCGAVGAGGLVQRLRAVCRAIKCMTTRGRCGVTWEFRSCQFAGRSRTRATPVQLRLHDIIVSTTSSYETGGATIPV